MRFSQPNHHLSLGTFNSCTPLEFIAAHQGLCPTEQCLCFLFLVFLFFPHLVVGAKMRRHMSCWQPGVGVDTSSWWIPVWIRGSEKAGWGYRQSRGVGSYKVHLLGVRMVGAHVGEVWRVFVHGWLRGVRLEGLSDSMEIKFVGIALTMNLSHNIFIIVVAECTAEFVIVHVRLAFPLPPAPSHFIRVGHLELPVGALPGDTVGVGAIWEKLQQELP